MQEGDTVQGGILKEAHFDSSLKHTKHPSLSAPRPGAFLASVPG